MMKFSRSKVEKEKIADREFRAGFFIPYKHHFNQNTMLTKNDELVQVIKLQGFSHETADDEFIDMQTEIRNMLIKGISAGEVSLYFHLIRSKHVPFPEGHNSVDMPLGFSSYLENKWIEKYRNFNTFVNELYITVIYKQSGEGTISSIESIITGLLRSADKESKRAKLITMQENIDEITGRIMNSLNAYKPSVLGIRKENGCYYSELIEFFARIVNCNIKQKLLVPSTYIYNYILNRRLYFGNRTIEVKDHFGKSRFAAMVSLKEYGPKSWPGMIDTFLQMPFEFIMTQSFSFSDKSTAISAMQLQQNRLIQSEDKAMSQIEEINLALDMAISGDIAFGKHHLTVMCLADDPKDLEQFASLTSVELTNTGGIGIREKVNMEPCFWGQLPGNSDFIVRKSTINTLNLVSLNSLHNFPVGKAKGNHWGDAVTILETTSGTPYYFSFHVRDVGHTTIIGPTGAGKTVLMNFLCAQAQRFNCRLFFFDKDRGAEIFIRALSGKYTIIDPSKKCGFNPLQLPDTGENRTFILDWLKQLVTVNGEEITAEDMEKLTNAVAGNYKLKQKDRRLSNIAPFLGIEGPGSLAGRLAMWHSKGSHASVFDNPEDIIDFDVSSIFGFEMAELLKDKVSLGPVLSYIFHRINLSLDGTPTMIVLDEAWALIDNPIFAPRIKDWLKVLRKLNTFVVFATQSVEDASKSSISDTLIQQTATQIFLPNLRATDVYRTTFMLTEREYNLIKSTDPGTRYFLVKQGSDAVIARVDLSQMLDVINVLSGRADTVLILDKVRAEHGEDPDVWIPIFNKRLTEVKDD